MQLHTELVLAHFVEVYTIASRCIQTTETWSPKELNEPEIALLKVTVGTV